MLKSLMKRDYKVCNNDRKFFDVLIKTVIITSIRKAGYIAGIDDFAASKRLQKTPSDIDLQCPNHTRIVRVAKLATIAQTRHAIFVDNYIVHVIGVQLVVGTFRRFFHNTQR
jgi:hypothetical protein